MPNITISIPDHLLEKARRYAAERGTSVNKLIREYLEELVGLNTSQLKAVLNELMELSDTYKGRLDEWDREDLYEERI
ncbi:hypothetical protein JCM13304A_00340 [Desulfothermus okinawensis JCM 13304]